MSRKTQEYYIGLDCGTNSVGWAVTDTEYRLLKGTRHIKTDNGTKTKKQTLWGFRLFDAADTAAERRTHRKARRCGGRTKSRLKLLRMLFDEEVAKVDSEFYQRLRESFYYEEDKNLQRNSKNSLFNDPDFADKDFHQKYPTIWHLRQAIINPKNADKPFDIRLYFLAIQHILKHRGHFLYDGSFKNGRGDFTEIFSGFCDTVNNGDYGFMIEPSMQENIEKIMLSDDSITDKKKRMKNLALFLENDEVDDPKVALQQQKCLRDLIAGGKTDLAKLFNIEIDEKCSYALSQLEEKESEIAEKIGSDRMPVLTSAKRIYDYAVLSKLLGAHQYLSDAMVANYDQHKKDLKVLKDIFRPHQAIYAQLFRDNKYDKKNNKLDVSKNPSYGVYAGNAYQQEGDRRGHITVSQEDFNKYVKKKLEEIGYQGELLIRAEKGELLPKQRGQAKGTIPQQLHHNELDAILNKLQQDFPSFADIVPGEDESYNTKAKKISKIHEFRIPYYCGPLVSKNKSEFSWADEEISELIYPWNFNVIMDKSGQLDKRANAFIRHMTNKCTFLVGEDVLPKCSLTYQKYMVLNELNNLKINGQRIDNNLKQSIFERGFKGGELNGNITLNRLAKWCQSNSLIGVSDELSGTSAEKTLPKYQTYLDFKRILGDDFEKQYSGSKLEEVIEAITVLGEEKQMLRRRVARALNLDEEDWEVKELAKLSYKGWGTMSERFLNGITVNNRTILDYLWEDNKNLVELRGQAVGFDKEINKYNTPHRPTSIDITWQDVNDLYCSSTVNRTVWQAIKIVRELEKNIGDKPKKIFLEVAREATDPKKKKGESLARKKQLIKLYQNVKEFANDAKKRLRELDDITVGKLQQKKLYLYFLQNAKCAYSGDPIEIEDILGNSQNYDIDHIYPRSLTKDDSILNNLVLVKRECNLQKRNKFLCELSTSWQQNMRTTWDSWHRNKLISDEKYRRLTCSTRPTPDELGSFIARQLIETSQSVMAIRDLLKRAYPETKIILVKAGQVSEYRHIMSRGGESRSKSKGIIKSPGMYEFIKVRELNDLHHAKDAYLNIVVGNVMNTTFTDNPAQWIKDRNGKDYTIRPEVIFREREIWGKAIMDDDEKFFRDRNQPHEKCSWPELGKERDGKSCWKYADSIKIVSDTMKRNDVIWTRMSYTESSGLSSSQLVGKTKKTDGILPIKQTSRFAKVDGETGANIGVEKYGGYNSIKGMYFTLIEQSNKTGELERKIVSIPQIARKNVDKYIRENYSNAKILIKTIKYKSLFKLGKVPLHLTLKTGDRLGFQHAMQLIVPDELAKDLKKVTNVTKKLAFNKDYSINKEEDCVNEEMLNKTYDLLIQKIQLYKDIPTLNAAVSRLLTSKDAFEKLNNENKCLVISNLFKAFSCGAEKGDLSSVLSQAKSIGRILLPSKIGDESLRLIYQSPTGLYEEVIDLKTVQPKVQKPKGK